MINKDVLHILQVSIKEKDPTNLYQLILVYFKADTHYHVERAWKLQAQHRLSNLDIVGELSHLIIDKQSYTDLKVIVVP